jgi:NAD(P)-dependent dehydrogenase (short-subunit alcohol dehydrogenase family)
MDQLEGRVVIVTGAGRGLGRSHALLLASEGARLVVNDLGTGVGGEGSDRSLAQQVVEEITEAGGAAVASGHDVADWDQAADLIDLAVRTFGELHVLVNNAGMVRDRTIANMSEEEWDTVVRVNLKGHAAPTRHAAAYWRSRSKEGHPVKASVIHTSSASGFAGNVGQANYGAAKMGIVTLARVLGLEAGGHGVRSNVIAPIATTRLALTVPGRQAPAAGTIDPLDPRDVSPLVAWLAAEQCPADGQIFHVYGNRIALVEIGRIAADVYTEEGWTLAELDRMLPPRLLEPPRLSDFAPWRKQPE